MEQNDGKKYGIRFSLPSDDPLAKPHLLGSDWEIYRWYNTREERDEAMEELSGQHPYNRLGDIATQVMEAVER